MAVLSVLSFSSMASDESIDTLKELGSIIGETASKAELQDSCAKVLEDYKKDKGIKIPSECREKVEGLVKELSENEAVKEDVSSLVKSLL